MIGSIRIGQARRRSENRLSGDRLNVVVVRRGKYRRWQRRDVGSIVAHGGDRENDSRWSECCSPIRVAKARKC